MSRAQTHYRGRRLTGMSFGKRGAPSYARIYLKSSEADEDALIRKAWEQAGYDAASDGPVWRVELELRSELLRTMAGEDGHLSRDPWELLAYHLDELWAHQLTSWLVLRVPTARTRIERCPPAPWWSALAGVRGLNGEAFGARQPLTRLPRPAADCTPLLRQAAGLLASVSAAKGGSGNLQEALAAFDFWMRDSVGQIGFSVAVKRARERRADAALADGWFPLGEAPPESAEDWILRDMTLPLDGPQVE